MRFSLADSLVPLRTLERQEHVSLLTCTHFQSKWINTEFSCVEYMAWTLLSRLGWEREVNYARSQFVHAFSDMSWNEFYNISTDSLIKRSV